MVASESGQAGEHHLTVYVGTRDSSLHVLRLNPAEGTLLHDDALDVTNLDCPSGALLYVHQLRSLSTSRPCPSVDHLCVPLYAR